MRRFEKTPHAHSVRAVVRAMACAVAVVLLAVAAVLAPIW